MISASRRFEDVLSRTGEVEERGFIHGGPPGRREKIMLPLLPLGGQGAMQGEDAEALQRRG